MAFGGKCFTISWEIVLNIQIPTECKNQFEINSNIDVELNNDFIYLILKGTLPLLNVFIDARRQSMKVEVKKHLINIEIIIKPWVTSRRIFRGHHYIILNG